MMDHPPTIIIVHPKERRSKCTVEALRGRAGFEFHTFTRSRPSDGALENCVRLALDGPVLGEDEADASRGLLVLDATWRYAQRMEAEYAHVPPRSLPGGWKTAYPRVSTIFDDPEQGLATIEAIYSACTILGRDTTGLLDEYHWRERFLELNRRRIISPQRH